MHIRAQLLQALLVLHAEALFLVDDEQAEIIELDRFRQQGMGANDDIHPARFHTVTGFRRLFARDQPGELFHFQRPAGKPLREGVVMLAREDGGRRDDGDLHPAHGGDKGPAQGNLGLAETDIAADQPVHGPAGGEIAQHIVNRVELVVGFLIGEARGELLIEAMTGIGDLALLQETLRRDLHQLGGHLQDALLGLRLSGLPTGPAKLVEHASGILAAIAADEVDILHRQEDPVAAGIFQLKAIMRRGGELQRLQPGITANAMIDMDDQVSL